MITKACWEVPCFRGNWNEMFWSRFLYDVEHIPFKIINYLYFVNGKKSTRRHIMLENYRPGNWPSDLLIPEFVEGLVQESPTSYMGESHIQYRYGG